MLLKFVIDVFGDIELLLAGCHHLKDSVLSASLLSLGLGRSLSGMSLGKPTLKNRSNAR